MKLFRFGTAVVALAGSVLCVSAGGVMADVAKKKKQRSVIVGLVTAPTEDKKVSVIQSKKRKGADKSTSNIVGLNHGSSGSGPATTTTEVLAGQGVAPMLSVGGAGRLRILEQRYASIAASGGWPKIGKAALKKGSEGDEVVALNKRLAVEGYLRPDAAEGQFAPIFTTATEDALMRFQRNNGLAVTGRTDGATIAALNISVQDRLRTIRANIPRLEIYEQGLSGRYLVVNIPAQQAESVGGGTVYARHNAIVGKPERPTPVAMTPLSKVKFNPYWNAPASIIERDIIPKIQRGGTRVLNEMDITVFQGFGGPEIDPDSVDWNYAVADDFHFRQNPGPHNAMATAKIEFDSPFGIYLHDTPEKQLFKVNGRFFSSGCVRIEQMPTMVNWVLNGQDGYNASRIATLGSTLEQVDVDLAAPPQLRVVYMTAWPVGDTVAFRRDIYELDSSGFTVGQPMPVGERSPEGLRYTLKPIPRLVAESDGDGFGWFGRRNNKGRPKGESSSWFSDEDNDGFGRAKDKPTRSVIIGLGSDSSGKKVKVKKDKPAEKSAKKKDTKPTKTVIVGLNDEKPKTKKKKKLKPTAAN